MCPSEMDAGRSRAGKGARGEVSTTRLVASAETRNPASVRVPSAENPPMVEQGPTPDIPPAAGAAPATQCDESAAGYDGMFGVYCELPEGHLGPHNDGVVTWFRNSDAPTINTFRLWVNMKGTILVRMWNSGNVEVARRDATWETWGPPETVFEEKV